MFVFLVVFSLLFAGRAVCDKFEEDEDEKNVAMVSTEMFMFNMQSFHQNLA